MAFLSPVHVGDEVSLFARLQQVGRTSMKIEVEAWRRARDSEESTKVTEATFTFVAIDEHRRPRAVPPAIRQRRWRSSNQASRKSPGNKRSPGALEATPGLLSMPAWGLGGLGARHLCPQK